MENNYRDYYAEHVSTIQKRWQLAMEAESFMAVLVHSGSPMFSFMDDYQYPFRPNPHFLAWVPLTQHAECALLIVPGKRPTLFYYQPDDYWHLPPADPEGYWAEHFDIEVVSDPDAWRDGIKAHLPDAEIDLGDVAAIGDSPVLRKVFKKKWINPEGLVRHLDLARTRKTPYEVACIAASARLAARAHVAAEQAFRKGKSEYGINRAYTAACGYSDAQLPYGNIVALNSHSSVLHYQTQDKTPPTQMRSFLIDAGCNVNGYASDITRTYAKEAGEFADLVAAMDSMQRGLCEQVRADVDYKQLHLITHRQVAGLLEEFKIINVSAEEAVETGLSSVFYPHGLGHFLGLQTHDVAGLVDNHGEAIPRPDGHPFLRLTRVLEAGNVLTIEPGLYFIEPLLRAWRANRDPKVINWTKTDELAPFGGIRIEDNLHVTEGGNENLTRKAFAEL